MWKPANLAPPITQMQGMSLMTGRGGPQILKPLLAEAIKANPNGVIGLTELVEIQKQL